MAVRLRPVTLPSSRAPRSSPPPLPPPPPSSPPRPSNSVTDTKEWEGKLTKKHACVVRDGGAPVLSPTDTAAQRLLLNLWLLTFDVEHTPWWRHLQGCGYEGELVVARRGVENRRWGRRKRERPGAGGEGGGKGGRTGKGATKGGTKGGRKGASGGAGAGAGGRVQHVSYESSMVDCEPYTPLSPAPTHRYGSFFAKAGVLLDGREATGLQVSSTRVRWGFRSKRGFGTEGTTASRHTSYPLSHLLR